ncbi:hypothetical protein EVAR_47058_1 [Eumeta japonica]|uniref:Uncharacterized protein n=1 Tax=Eumeta variegata TaxID=151549 RepID=A0A4C1WKU8_EUMVA|nr:hypothetical protein EVAR_47058_1 [Eumeta japonica]
MDRDTVANGWSDHEYLSRIATSLKGYAKAWLSKCSVDVLIDSGALNVSLILTDALNILIRQQIHKNIYPETVYYA